MVLKRKLKTFFSECVKGDCWENVVRKQRWFSNSRRSRAGRWEKLSRRAIFPNVLQLGEVAEIEAQIFSLSQKFNRRTAVEFGTKPAILPNCCYTTFLYSIFTEIFFNFFFIIFIFSSPEKNKCPIVFSRFFPIKIQWL